MSKQWTAFSAIQEMKKHMPFECWDEKRAFAYL